MPKYFAVYSEKTGDQRCSAWIESGDLKAATDEQALEKARNLIILMNENPRPGSDKKYVLRKVIKQIYP